MEFNELRNRLKQAGLFEKQPRYYFTLFFLIAVGYASCLAILTQRPSDFVLFITAIALASFTVQCGFLSHDASHGAIFRSRALNDLVGFLAADLLGGFSFGWYAPLHAKHHANPHHDTLDPDVVLYETVFALSEKKAARARGIDRLVIRNQGWLFPLIMSMQSFALKYYAFRFLLLEKSRRRGLELLLLAIHYTLYCWFFLHFLGPVRGAAVVLVHQLVVGFHLSVVFASNHIGLPLRSGEAPDWVAREVEPTRNVESPPALDFLWGGLNHHIEHHLFPAISRNLVRRAAPVVKQFFDENLIRYNETSFVECYRDVFASVRTVGQAASQALSRNG